MGAYDLKVRAYSHGSGACLVARMVCRWSRVPGGVCSEKGVPRGQADGPLAWLR